MEKGYGKYDWVIVSIVLLGCALALAILTPILPPTPLLFGWMPPWMLLNIVLLAVSTIVFTIFASSPKRDIKEEELP